MVITATAGSCVSEVTVTSPADCDNPCEDPLISLSEPLCTSDSEYSVSFSEIPNATVVASAGTINASTNTVEGIPTGTDLTLTISFAGCEDQAITVASPTDCDACVAPIVTINGVEECDPTGAWHTYSVSFITNGMNVSVNEGTPMGNMIVGYSIRNRFSINSR